MLRLRLAVVTAVYVGAGALLVLSPDPAAPQWVVTEVQRTLLDFAGDRGSLRKVFIEVTMNVALAVPAPVLAHRWLPAVPWWGWLSVGAAASAAIELFQLAVAPESRTASLRDVAANTVGVAIGCLIVARRDRSHPFGSPRPMIPADDDQQHRGA